MNSMLFSYAFPEYELSVLREFYDDLDGENWLWLADEEAYGIPWNFTGNPDPCTDRWQGIYCTCGTSSSYRFQNHYSKYASYGYTDFIATYYSDTESFSVPEIASVNACNVEKLNLAGYGLSGTIPNTLSNLTLLQGLRLADNSIEGTVNAYLWNLTSLEVLTLDKNLFTGDIPYRTESITQLAFWNLNANHFEGSVPASVCSNVGLKLLSMADNTGLTGSLPDCLGDLTQMETFYAYRSSIGGSIPQSICNWDNIVYFALQKVSLTASSSTVLLLQKHCSSLKCTKTISLAQFRIVFA